MEIGLPKKEKQLRTTTTITEEEDKEAHLNSTQTHLDEDELSVIISSITGDTDNSEWIRSKSTMATRIQAEINQQKKKFTPGRTHGSWMDVGNFNFCECCQDAGIFWMLRRIVGLGLSLVSGGMVLSCVVTPALEGVCWK